MKPVSCRLSLSLLFVVFVAGCGSSGQQLGAVTGTVTLDGKPVPGALVTFISKEPGGTSSYGRTDANGKYRLEFTTDQFGAMVGGHDVTIVTTRVSKEDESDTGMVVKTEFVPIPIHYARGALTVEVKSGSNVHDFALTTAKPN